MPNSLTVPPVRPVLDRLFQAADSDQTKMTDYLSYVRDPDHGYVSVSFPESDGLEISCRV